MASYLALDDDRPLTRPVDKPFIQSVPSSVPLHAAANNLILIVDDEIVTLKIIAAVLERAGYNVIVSTNGSDALNKIEQYRPNLVLLDLVMPGMDGYQVCQIVRRSPAIADTPIIMFSGLDRPADQRLAFAAGGDDYITKPVRRRELLAKVRAMLFFQE